MQTAGHRPGGLPALVGVGVVVVARGLERAHDRSRGLEQLGYRTTPCGDPAQTAACVKSARPEAVVIDIGRESGPPGEVVARVRQLTSVPVVVVGATASYAEMLRCYEAGADDYCHPRAETDEVDLRLRAIFRRMGADLRRIERKSGPKAVTVGDIEVDPGSQTVRKHGELVPLSPTEFRLLATLAEHPGEVIPSKALIARVWGSQYAGESHYLRLYIRYLRQKLEDVPSEPTYILNRWGSGYSLDFPKRVAARAG